ncbi:MAG: DUF389 domain-containing protein, partial [Synechococcales bacterium]|nr:DUF389 domain-containing protein [Synechococcales bacterium]
MDKRSLLKVLARGRRFTRKLFYSNSGDWQWLATKPASINGINRLLWRESVPSLSYFVMLSLSGAISTLGLLSGSTATVIGAMIIAPLMGPMIGIAYAIAAGNRRLLKRAGLTLTLSLLVTIGSAAFFCQVVGLRILNEEILARTQPTLIDLVVAMAAGAAGAFAKSRKYIADAFPGVAIAVALVPPLSVIGIGLALWDVATLTGSVLLFITNLTGIIFSGIIVFLAQGYGSPKKAQEGMTFTFALLVVIGFPLGISLRNLLVQANTRQYVQELIRQRVEALNDVAVQSVRVQRRQGVLHVS